MATATTAELQAQVAELTAKLNKATAPKPITLKVSEKGAVSVYGLNARFPVTLYRQQMERLLEKAPDIQKFMLDNAAKLAVKE
jgi:hypothetical protein